MMDDDEDDAQVTESTIIGTVSMTSDGEVRWAFVSYGSGPGPLLSSSSSRLPAKVGGLSGGKNLYSLVRWKRSLLWIVRKVFNSEPSGQTMAY